MEFQKLIEYRNGIPGFAKEMGMKVTEVKAGYARVEMELDVRSHNPIGSTHGGVIFAIADTAGGVAASSRGSYVTTVEGSIHYLNAAMQGTKKLVAATRELKAGKNILVYDVTVSDETGQVIAEARMSYFSLHKPIEL